MKLCYQAVGLVCMVLMATGCHDAPIGDDFAEKQYQPQGAVISPRNVQIGFFDLGDPDNAAIAFDLETIGEPVSSAEVVATHDDGSSATFTSVSEFPSTIDVTLNEVLAILGKTIDDVEVGDEVRFTFTAATATGTYRSSESLAVPFSCRSDLKGTYNYKSSNYFCSGDELTGTVELIEEAAGKYGFDDWSFGTYPECYGGSASSWGSLQLVDVCNRLSVTGVDNYGDSWQFVINSISGPDLNATWSNTYGEFGTVVISRTDGSDWPPLSN
ncbi:MAG: hypothetical protein R3301_05350 [Saprospiraceae bacterium]|nr:hypothetical protein [Saprospiraceae bacterium]